LTPNSSCGYAAQELPALEDIFTCIDLAAGTGHDLGVRKYTPKVLRAIRRMAIYRIFSVLDRRFSYSPEIESLLSECCPHERPCYAFVVLQEELPNGTSRIVADEDTVHLHEHLHFTAIAPDDNS
jgi:hypothetical protein